MINKIDYVFSSLNKVKFPPFMANGMEKHIGYCEIVKHDNNVLTLSNDKTGVFDCFYHLIGVDQDISDVISDCKKHNKTTLLIHNQFLFDDLTEKELSFMLRDGGYKCNIGLVDIYTAAQVGGICQYSDY